MRLLGHRKLYEREAKLMGTNRLRKTFRNIIKLESTQLNEKEEEILRECNGLRDFAKKFSNEVDNCRQGELDQLTTNHLHETDKLLEEITDWEDIQCIDWIIDQFLHLQLKIENIPSIYHWLHRDLKTHLSENYNIPTLSTTYDKQLKKLNFPINVQIQTQFFDIQRTLDITREIIRCRPQLIELGKLFDFDKHLNGQPEIEKKSDVRKVKCDQIKSKKESSTVVQEGEKKSELLTDLNESDKKKETEKEISEIEVPKEEDKLPSEEVVVDQPKQSTSNNKEVETDREEEKLIEEQEEGEIVESPSTVEDTGEIEEAKKEEKEKGKIEEPKKEEKEKGEIEESKKEEKKGEIEELKKEEKEKREIEDSKNEYEEKEKEKRKIEEPKKEEKEKGAIVEGEEEGKEEEKINNLSEKDSKLKESNKSEKQKIKRKKRPLENSEQVNKTKSELESFQKLTGLTKRTELQQEQVKKSIDSLTELLDEINLFLIHTD
ncbi:hypothetical protein SNEBB_008791 [Seison nebaliae]|nr:hypothetical protein SNEBB_008791 [Seison nebaliae]